MAYKFCSKSKGLLSQCHPDLQALLNEAIKGSWDFTIVSARRTPDEQKLLVEKGVSMTLNSKHVAPEGEPSLAVDIAPWYGGEGIRWKDDRPFYMLAGYIQHVAEQLGLGDRFRYGADWDGDHRIKGDQRLHDPGHIEIAG